VFQNYALYPHLSVFENIAFPLRLHGKHSEEEIRRLVQEAADTLELQEHLERKPSQLSGGQRQRVAMGRAIVRQADAFLFDEPLSNLDAKLRGQMRTEILRLQRRLGVTTVYVTHDQTEAMTLGDRVAVLKRGLLQQVASPRELYEQPVNLFVAGFIGSPPMNFVPAVIKGDVLELPFVDLPLHDEWRSAVGDRTLFIAGIRPGAFEDSGLVDPSKKDRGVTFDVTVDVTEWLGNEQYAFVPYEAPPEISSKLAELESELDSEQMRTQMCVELDPMSRVSDGARASLWLDPSRIHLFDPKTGDNLTRVAAEGGANAGRHRTGPTEQGVTTGPAGQPG
jgi:multiple sugar transport system ATP-binding protein